MNKGDLSKYINWRCEKYWNHLEEILNRIPMEYISDLERIIKSYISYA